MTLYSVESRNLSFHEAASLKVLKYQRDWESEKGEIREGGVHPRKN